MTIELAELVAQLRAELAEAMRAGSDADLRFEVGPVELELTVAVDKSVDGSGKIRFWVLEMGTDTSVSSTTTQRIKLTLDPRRGDAPDNKVTIDGTEITDER